MWKNIKNKLSMPDAFVIIFVLIMLAALATYFLPSGSFERHKVDGITQVVPNSFEFTQSSPANIMDLFESIQLGLIETADIIFLIFIIGGIVNVIEHSGAINASIHTLISKTRGNYIVLNTSVMLIFGILASMGIVANAVIAFIPIGVVLAKSLKLDAITGIAIIYLGYYSGMIAGVFDPVILGYAQNIAELPLFSGIGLRIVIFICLITISILYVNRYATKVKKDPNKSLVTDSKITHDEDSSETNVKFTWTHKIILLTFVVYLGIFVYGAFTRDWGINELVTIFLMMGVTVAIFARITPNKFVKIFIEGASSLTYGALVVGLARGVIVIMENGHIMDTIVNSLLVPLQSMGPFLGGELLFVFNWMFNLLVTSGTGQASIVMPIMIPIVDLIGITRQTGVLAFMLGDGFTNIIAPTSGVLMAVLAIGKVKWTNWVKFVFPLLMLWSVVGLIAVGYAILTNYGPF